MRSLALVPSRRLPSRRSAGARPALLAALAVLGACGGAPARTTLPAPGVTPASDLAAARSRAPRAEPPGIGTARDTRLEARDPRVIDLDIIRITAHASGPGGAPELTSVASADLFKQ
ncbi:MAG TPA: hypothetical protein VFT22_41645, partial [Kofleriaceae bacterium]|nr:hypothetical protein [Kofleriaceae bacterium]